MNKQELIKIYEDTSCTLISINGVLEDLRQLDEPQPIKLKDVIARIKGFDLGTKTVWIDAILSELGSDYGTLKYKAGYEQGKFEGEWVGQQLKDADKIRRELNRPVVPQKPVVPQFVADWYEEHKDDFEIALFRCIDHIPSVYDEGDLNEFEEWIIDGETKPFQTLVNMHQFGYEIEKEKRYRVSLKNGQPLLKAYLGKALYFSQDIAIESYKVTRKELEEAGFGEVFNSPLFEVEEVEE